MGVYIKGVEKPKQCHGCFCYSNLWQDADGYGETCCWCGALRRKFNRNKLDIHPFKEVLPDCPLIEVKTPHGRLIDGDRFYEEFEPNSWSEGMAVSTYIKKAPTVIEAEVE